MLLFKLEFDLPLLSNEHYVLGRLNRLRPAEVEQLKELFVKNKHPRFKKEFPGPGRRQPFFEAAEYKRCIESVDLAKMAKLIKIVGMLLQTKVYLFWKHSSP